MSYKLHQSLIELVEADIITSEISLKISAYYKERSTNSSNKLFAIFGVLGSLLIGLGIILLLAHNWDDFTRATKTILVFVPLVTGQLFTGYVLFRNKSGAWKETAATFLYFAIGASVSLVSQVYNIPGSMSNFLMVWIALGSPLIYLLRSHAAAILHLVFITSYACNVGYFNSDVPWGYLIMFAWTLPFYYQQLKLVVYNNLTGIYNWLMPLSIIISLGGFMSGSETFGFVLYICLFGLLYNLGKLPCFSNKRIGVNGYRWFGSIGIITVLIITSFTWIWIDASKENLHVIDGLLTLILGAFTVIVMVHTYRRGVWKFLDLYQWASFIFIGIYASAYLDSNVSMVLMNLLIFILGVITVVRGVRQEKFSILNYGLFIITLLVVCRFFDTELSFALRGLLFVVVGLGFFGTNYILFKKTKGGL